MMLTETLSIVWISAIFRFADGAMRQDIWGNRFGFYQPYPSRLSIMPLAKPPRVVEILAIYDGTSPGGHSFFPLVVAG